MQVKIRIKRFTPQTDLAPRWISYAVDMEPSDRVLDVLHHVKWYCDGSLAFRRSCAHGICGSDAMMVNGKNRLACRVLVKDLKQPITIEPMRGFPVIRDLVVDMRGFFDKYRKIRPYLINDTPPPPSERLQSQQERARYDDTTKCILCGACTTSCPSFWTNKEYLGPAAIVQAHRFIFDSRDHRADERLKILNESNGVWRCRTIFNCTDACPRGISVTKAIGEVKKLLAGKFLRSLRVGAAHSHRVSQVAGPSQR